MVVLEEEEVRKIPQEEVMMMVEEKDLTDDLQTDQTEIREIGNLEVLEEDVEKDSR